MFVWVSTVSRSRQDESSLDQKTPYTYSNCTLIVQFTTHSVLIIFMAILFLFIYLVHSVIEENHSWRCIAYIINLRYGALRGPPFVIYRLSTKSDNELYNIVLLLIPAKNVYLGELWAAEKQLAFIQSYQDICIVVVL